MSPSVVHVTGARPNFPKAAPVISALAAGGIRQKIVHTGQHYDDRMSAVFFEQLSLPKPDINLGVGSGTHAHQTASIMMHLEDLLVAERPDLVVVYGDVNSTVAASLTAAKLCIPLAHVEAGLRSFDNTMPEEVNRLVTDRLSDLLLATSPDAVAHLGREGTPAHRIHLVGNPMIDTLLRHLDATAPSRVSEHVRLPERFAVATLHRPGNIDDAVELDKIVRAITEVAEMLPLVLPVHPRSRVHLERTGLLDHPHVHPLEPLGYLEFISLVRGSELVITDSGGVQEETTVLGIPCLTLRPNTERPVTITHGTNRLTKTAQLAEDVRVQLSKGRPSTWPVPPLWDGRAGERIGSVIGAFLGHTG
ncbi:MAG TPA: UDP-N-acetylglucosamine 2-epimerase (non-hydrolyzing) [Nocardioidaceae bacterium]|nr:UDP-N-acetylglucosamine 2-epimerase (non-hydrolyzing) [Nocardioidaceae bacterium]